MSDHNFRYFMLNNLAIESAIRSIEAKTGLDFGHVPAKGDEQDQVYYPQFSEQVREEAERMAKNYVLFYSLENSIRDLITDVLSEKYGHDWWVEPGVVPEVVSKSAENNQKKESGAGVTVRSDRMIDYTNFGELGEIIKANWDDFGSILRDKRAVERILANLNTLRASIAHCTALAPDEELRLHLSLRDWFRQQA
jgi:hypothetical protein